MLDTQQILGELILHAESGEHMEFRYIRTLRERRALKRSKRSLKNIIKVLNATAKTLFKNYCDDIKYGQTSTSKLITYNILKKTATFYQEDYHIIESMLGEYEIYLISGNLFDFVLYGGRPEKKLWDYRRFFDGDVNDQSI